MDRKQAEAILKRFPGKRVLVVGDLMVDEYVYGQVSRVSPEAPVLVVDAESHSFVLGGAANVVHNLRDLGAEVVVAGVVGPDGTGERLLDDLRALGADTSAVVVDEDRPTTQKTRIVAGTQQVVRVDREKRTPLPEAVAAQFVGRVSDLMTVCDALLFSDYDKGVLTQNTVRRLLSAARSSGGNGNKGIVVTANPKPPSARYYAGADVVQLNRVEAEQASGAHLQRAPEDTFHAVGGRLRESLQVRNLLITRSAQGLTLFREDGTYQDVAPHLVEVYDGTGAGDSTISGLTLALAAGATLEEAMSIGNAAGGAVVRKVGVVTASPREIAALFDPGS